MEYTAQYILYIKQSFLAMDTCSNLRFISPSPPLLRGRRISAPIECATARSVDVHGSRLTKMSPISTKNEKWRVGKVCASVLKTPGASKRYSRRVTGWRRGAPTYQCTHPSRSPRRRSGGALAGTSTSPISRAASLRAAAVGSGARASASHGTRLRSSASAHA